MDNISVSTLHIIFPWTCQDSNGNYDFTPSYDYREYPTDIGQPRFGHQMKVYNVKLVDKSCQTTESRPIYVTEVKTTPVSQCEFLFVNHAVLYGMGTTQKSHISCSYKVGQLMAETFWNRTTPQEACTRNMPRRMLSKLDNMGLQFYSGMELEFTLMNLETQLPVFSGDRNRLMLLQAEYEPWFYDVASRMKRAGVSVGTMHIEYNPGQFEFTTQPRFGIEAADGALILKQGIKEMAAQRGWHANFMTRPFLKEPGNAGHFNFSVWHNNMNYFWDESAEDNISTFGKHWIAGMIHHAKALTALGFTTTNCYHALQNNKPAGMYIL